MNLFPMPGSAFILGFAGSVLLLSQITLHAEEKTPSPAHQGIAGNADVEKTFREFQGKGDLGDGSKPMTPQDTMASMQLADGLKVELVAAEPQVMQPLYMSFDARGRLWVVQYLQYPFPAGLKILRYDQYLRAVFDSVPKPPPHHVPGLDRITVFEDTDGDGVYDHSKDVITGLNITSSVLAGRGGIWVLNPPYLLFYPDANGDDIPDSDPEVRLSGFGLEDTHAVANSMAWGPDGWIYGAMGSTTTASVSSEVSRNVAFEGQCIWRYHPVTDVFEVFAEGGGNTFSFEFDNAGRAFSGTNHNNTRGMYYPQGSYGEKNFGKHGPLTNPAAFGHFVHMRHEGDQRRFPQTFLIYQGGTLPRQYWNGVIAANALHHQVWGSELIREGSTYRTVDFPAMCDARDTWFRPVDIKTGPDGAVYLADWYDARLSHVDPRDTWHKTSGRIYRLQGKEAHPQGPFDLTRCSDNELFGCFDHPNKWQRQTAVRLLSERLQKDADQKISARLRKLIHEDRPSALEALWTLASAQAASETELASLLSHPQPEMRSWAIRLLGDARTVTSGTAVALADVASGEPDVQVRSQLAATAKRLTATQGLPILRQLIHHDEDAVDPHLPLMIWWGIEAHCGHLADQPNPHLGVQAAEESPETAQQEVLQLFADKQIWAHPIAREVLGGRIMRRFALAGARAKPESPEALAAWGACEQLLQTAPSDVQPILMAGFVESCQGSQLGELPDGLKQSILNYQKQLGQSDLVLAARLGQPEAIASALKFVASEKSELPVRLALIELFGEVDIPQSAPVLLNLLRSPSAGIKIASLRALTRYSNPQIAKQICSLFQSTLPAELGLRDTAFRTLASRLEWSGVLLEEIEQNRLTAASIPSDVVQQLRYHPSPELQDRITKIWGPASASEAEKLAELQRVRALLGGLPNNAEEMKLRLTNGHELFKKNCANCHTLFAEGNQIGPNLTGYERTNREFMLQAIIDPSAGIREEYTQFQIATEDGRILSGLITERNSQTVTLRDANNHLTTIPRNEIEILQGMTKSLMPDGLLKKLTDDEVIDLFVYLMQPAPSSATVSAPAK